MSIPDGFATEVLDDTHTLGVGTLPDELLLDGDPFETLWAENPGRGDLIHLHGREVETPRWQRAYGADYRFSGQVSHATETPAVLQPLWDWVRTTIDPRLNGLLVIWYDAEFGHYIGKHRDSTQNMVDGAPIVTVSFGAERVFRLRPWRGKGFRDFPTPAGRVFVMPYATNLAWTHEVPHRKSEAGRRISVTFRAFAERAE